MKLKLNERKKIPFCAAATPLNRSTAQRFKQFSDFKFSIRKIQMGSFSSFTKRNIQLTVHVADDKVDTIIPGICHIQNETRNYFSQFDDILL